jgi:hypothetical protein
MLLSPEVMIGCGHLRSNQIGIEGEDSSIWQGVLC